MDELIEWAFVGSWAGPTICVVRSTAGHSGGGGTVAELRHDSTCLAHVRVSFGFQTIDNVHGGMQANTLGTLKEAASTTKITCFLQLQTNNLCKITSQIEIQIIYVEDYTSSILQQYIKTTAANVLAGLLVHLL